jgi:hypothetical protein
MDATDDGLVTKRLATGEIAIWDSSRRTVIVVNEHDQTAKFIKGSTLKELESKLAGVVVLV